MASISAHAARSTGSRTQLKDGLRRKRKDGKSPRRHARKARLRASRTAPPHSSRTSASHENGRGSRDVRGPLAKLCLPIIGNEQWPPTSSRCPPFSGHAAMFKCSVLQGLTSAFRTSDVQSQPAPLMPPTARHLRAMPAASFPSTSGTRAGMHSDRDTRQGERFADCSSRF